MIVQCYTANQSYHSCMNHESDDLPSQLQCNAITEAYVVSLVSRKIKPSTNKLHLASRTTDHDSEHSCAEASDTESLDPAA